MRKGDSDVLKSVEKYRNNEKGKVSFFPSKNYIMSFILIYPFPNPPNGMRIC